MFGSLLRQSPYFEALRLPPARYPSSAIGELCGALAAGMVIGAVTALLLAPKSGSEIRKDLRRRFRVLRDRNEQFAERVRAEGGLPDPEPIKHIAP